jgi:hypothetical protein
MDQGLWPHLPVGTVLTIVKRAPDGNEATRYAGTVIDAGATAPWVAVEAIWNHRPYDIDGLLFLPGDMLHEFFSPRDWFNAFSVFAPDGSLRGWYANVTYPASLDLNTDPWTLTWHDLYLDLVALPDGTVVSRDEDELAEAGLAKSAPSLFQCIVDAHQELRRLADARSFPFHESP